MKPPSRWVGSNPVGTPVGGHVWSKPPPLARVKSARSPGGSRRMSETQALRVSPARTAGASASAAGGRDRHGHRVARRLWSLLNAQALLDGTARGPGVVVEDDGQRLAGRRAR